jgi:hypothetical protein
MNNKIIMQWDIRSGVDKQYPEFVVNEFAPALTRMGLRIVEVWYTLYGNAPQITVAAVARNERHLQRILSGEEWQDVHARLLVFVENYQRKIVPDRGRFQL